MTARLILIKLLILVLLVFAGCAPKELFSCVDRHCFVADWTNHHSCLSCCQNGGCGQRYVTGGEMLVLGDVAPADSDVE